MATYIGIGFSEEIQAEKAVEESIRKAKNQLGRHPAHLALLLSTIHYDPNTFFPIVQKELGKTRLIGCSSAGVILKDSILNHGIAILLISSDDIEFGIGSVDNVDNDDMRQIGVTLARNCLNDFGKYSRHVFVVFTDGFLKNNSLLLKGVQEVLGNVFPVIGAGSCDDFHFTHTFQLIQNKVLNYSTLGLLLGGHVSIGIGGRHGWRPLGRPRIADQVDTNIIKTIDGKPAIQIYQEFFGEESRQLYAPDTGSPMTSFSQMAILYPLGIYVEESREYLLRNAIDINVDGSIVCQGEIPHGSQVHLMIGSKDACKSAALEAAQEAHNNLLGKQAKFIFIIESMARLKLLGRMALQEIQQIQEIFGKDIPLMGMYAHGEIYPLQTFDKFKNPHFQNESIVILAVS